MKATSIFGGVQVFNIIIAIIRSKVIAVLLGPAGMGIAGLFNSSIGLVGNLTNFGLGRSAVKNIAEANESSDSIRIAKVAKIFRKLVWITGLLGAVLCFVLASYLSQLSFGNKEYTYAFQWLSITLLFNQLTSGRFVLLQGMRKLKLLAKANMLGSVVGLFATLPLYYYYNVKGIVPAIILTAFFTFCIAWYFSRKIKAEKVSVSSKETKEVSKEMLTMGFMLSLKGFIVIGASYIIRIYISNVGGIDDVGLYTAGFAIIGTYVGLVFSAMGTDFYPRLSGVAHDNEKAALLINQQAEIGLLILAPILTAFFIFINWAVILLYSQKFIAVNGMIQWAALGMYFRVGSWAIAFILLAKGASKLFFWNELVANIYKLAFNILGYYFWGLEGLGISFLLSFIFYLFQIYYLAHYKYQFSFNTVFYRIFIFQFIIGICGFLITKFLPSPLSYFLGLPVIFASCWYSYKELDKRMGLKEVILNLKDKYVRKR
ncbi:MAG: O-antigen translocase [Lutibacter sp.]|nr:MAG: O-antigen translocase [Lutibacter sp.]